MENNCVVLQEFEVPGGTMFPGRKLGLDAVLRERWMQMGLVGAIAQEEKPIDKPAKKRRRRTVKATTLA